MEKTEALEHAQKALHIVRINIPWLSSLTDNLMLKETPQIETAAISATGTLYFNPEWLFELKINDAAFVIAHEIMHLALRSHERTRKEDQQLFNITHDFIINDMLKEVFGIDKVPANGLDWRKEYGWHYSIKGKSAEELMKFIKDALEKGELKKSVFRKPWSSKPYGDEGKHDKANRPFAEKLKDLVREKTTEKEEGKKATHIEIPTDVLSNELEKKLYPVLSRDSLKEKEKTIKNEISKALSRKVIFDVIEQDYQNLRGYGAGSGSSVYGAIQSMHKPPWEVALQTWLEHTARTGRTYARPSRRGQYRDFVLPGFRREGYTLHIVLDTSGSMDSDISEVLGVIASFCEALMVPEIHVIQCDVEVTEDQWYTPDQLRLFQVKGLGGSDMTNGMLHLAKDEQVEQVIVITDGHIGYPDEPMPYNVLWVITEPQNTFFNPPYGRVIFMERNQINPE